MHPVRKLQLVAGLLVLTLLTPVIHAQVVRTVRNAGVTRMGSATVGNDTLRELELSPNLDLFGDVDAALGGADHDGAGIVNRSFAQHEGEGDRWAGKKESRQNPALVTSFNGINHRQQRLANNGNQFSLEPPDQGLCAGNGFVLETVNDALRIFNRDGNALTGVVSQNEFYGYAPALVRPAGPPFGPLVTDPSCLFDQQTQRWFHVVLTLDVDPASGNFTGPNHLDLAVSVTADPLGAYNVYRIPAQNDGTQGTPNHHCTQFGPHNTLVPGPCLGDYPHIGADRNGIYITTNEFDFFGPFFEGAQIYALPKQALASGAASVNVVLFNTNDPANLLEGNPGFTVWPAQSPGRNDSGGGKGTEFLLSSLAVFTDAGTENRLRIWAVQNTRSLNTDNPNLSLVSNFVNTLTYGVPPKSNQKPGDFPLGQCINDTTISTPFGPGCWQFLFVKEPAHHEVEYKLDSNDSRMQQVFLANGKLYGALDTAVTVGGVNKAGVAFFLIKPETGDSSVSGEVESQDVLALENNNLTYPAIAALNDGRAVIAFTVAGADHFPSAGYVGVNQDGVAGDIQIAAEGLGPADGFSGYRAFTPAGRRIRPRWGDYGAAATDGNSFWIASEYIGQTCTLAQYVASPFGSCGGTRTSLANWGTRISRVLPGND